MVGHGVSGSGGGGADSAGLAGYATQAWVAQKFLSIDFFNRIFKAHSATGDVLPNDTETTITDIEALFGFWTEQYISALGENSSGGGGGGVGDVTWDLLASNSDTRQIALSHLTGALSGYATQSWVQQQGYLTGETDPTVPAWAKASTKPSYSFSEIGGTVAFSQLPTLYWANVPVGSSSNAATSPTFSTLGVSGATTLQALTVNGVTGFSQSVTFSNKAYFDDDIVINVGGTEMYLDTAKCVELGILS